MELRQLGQGIDLASLARREQEQRPENRSHYYLRIARGETDNTPEE